MLSTLVGIVKKNTGMKSKRLQNDQLKTWDTSIAIFKEMLNMIKKISTPRNFLGPILKNARQFLDHFLKHGMPLVDKLFMSQQEDCKNLLKALQSCTRYLHNICNFARRMQENSLAAHVPLLKKIMEELVNRVKAMCALNACLDAYWLGNLKNRDLKGELL